MKISKLDNYEKSPVFFDEHFYFFKYQREIREFIIKYKFDEKSYMYKSFAKLIIEDKIFMENFIKKYDYIISVPIHIKRTKQRGYNQSKLIAKEIATKCSNIENFPMFIDDVLIKNKNIVAQSSLDDKLDRIRNIKNAFNLGKNRDNIKEKNILIIDDVFTTGATVNECAKVLKENGVSKVGVFTIAKS